MAIATATVAEFFLAKAQEHGDLITHLKLQKLIYYAQAWYLALFDERLFDEELEAWVHGPVAPSIYQAYRCYGWQPIVETATKPSLDERTDQHLNEVYAVFGGFTAYDMEMMTHAEAPWINARGGLPKDEPSTNIISTDDMKTYYRQVAGT